jgi:hypothetical protein
LSHVAPLPPALRGIPFGSAPVALLECDRIHVWSFPAAQTDAKQLFPNGVAVYAGVGIAARNSLH